MNYNAEFRNLISSDSKSGDFIGFGNPNSKILIIGKECALDLDNPKDKFIYEKSNKPNHTQWLANINDENATLDIPTWGSTKIFNPLFPYNGDKLSDLPKGNSTWRNYQKLINILYPQAAGEITTFHQYCFITEFNDIPMNYSINCPEAKRSVQNRCTNILSHQYFKEFPVVIAACGHYIDTYSIDLQTLFNQVWDGPTESIGRGEWINVHRNNERLLLHTRQLSICSNKLINRLAELCTDYIK